MEGVGGDAEGWEFGFEGAVVFEGDDLECEVFGVWECVEEAEDGHAWAVANEGVQEDEDAARRHGVGGVGGGCWGVVESPGLTTPGGGHER